MERIKNIDAFCKFQDQMKRERKPRIPTIVISSGTCGQASGANDLIRITKRELLSKGLTENIHLRITGCHGFCEMEPSVLIEPERIFYPKIGIEKMVRIVDAVNKGHIIDNLLFIDQETNKQIAVQDNIPFYKRQTRIILGRNEQVDPIRISTYIQSGGYSALIKVLKRKDPEWVINEVKASGLRGRGGGGFPTGLKWEILTKQPNGRGKFLICNADEGDPGAYMDRSVLEGNPQSIIEGMIIGGFGTGANQGVIYVRNEYPLAIKHLIIALRQARELGILGENILGSGFSFDIKMVKGAGAFVCGEETALIRSIEGKRGEPRQRPPYPVQKGIDNNPTVINNVETWANIPVIINDGAVNFTKIGTEGNSGTKIFSLVGKVKYTGLVEVPMGTSIKEIIYDIGGGPSNKAKIKAVQTGGPSGGCIPACLFDLPIDYDSLTRAGSIMGSGGMIVMDENTCMVDVAKYFTNFLKDESCGKCYTCRKGTQRMYEILDDITRGKGTLSHLDLLKELGEVVKDTSMCGLGQTAANPVLSTLRYFMDEYQQHIIKKRCNAFVCKDLTGVPCQSACPLGTEAWRYIAHIQKGEYEEAYLAIREPNPFPSVCARVCHHPCESKCRAGINEGQSIAIRALKRFITDRFEPSTFKYDINEASEKTFSKIAVIGSGPAGLTAAHYLSLKGYKITLFETEQELGGMLLSCIPSYRLPRHIIRKEIESLLNGNITINCDTTFGCDLNIEDLFGQGFKAIFIAIGAHQSLPLGIKGEGSEGVYSSMDFLKTFNLKGKELGHGHVGIIGGGNSAIDAARVAIRQKDVNGVTIFYRRTRLEMPAFEEEITAALDEGVKLNTLISPVRIIAKNGHLVGVEFIKNRLGDVDASGRRMPVPIVGSEFIVNLETLVVAIGETPVSDKLISQGLECDKKGRVKVDIDSLCTNIEGVFAGGDFVTGPNTVVDAIAAGKKAAAVIDRYLRGKDLREPAKITRPSRYIEPLTISEEEVVTATRICIPVIRPDVRRTNFEEVEKTICDKEALVESKRCLRCDIEFSKPDNDEGEITGNISVEAR